MSQAKFYDRTGQRLKRFARVLSFCVGAVWLAVAAPAYATYWVTGPWEIACHKDSMTDVQSCRVDWEEPHMFDNGIRVAVKPGSTTLRVGVENYPGSTMTIRVDNNSPHSIPENSRFAIGPKTALWREFKAGAALRYRWYNWPYEQAYERTVPLDSLVAAIEQAQDYVATCNTAECPPPHQSQPDPAELQARLSELEALLDASRQQGQKQ